MREKKTEPLYVLCEPSFMVALRRRAHVERMPLSRLVRNWLRDAMEEKPLELASHGLTEGENRALIIGGDVRPKET